MGINWRNWHPNPELLGEQGCCGVKNGSPCRLKRRGFSSPFPVSRTQFHNEPTQLCTIYLASADLRSPMSGSTAGHELRIRWCQALLVLPSHILLPPCPLPTPERILLASCHARTHLTAAQQSERLSSTGLLAIYQSWPCVAHTGPVPAGGWQLPSQRCLMTPLWQCTLVLSQSPRAQD